MKKVTYVLAFLFVTTLGITALVTANIVNNDVPTCTVDQNNDEKPCPAGCTCENCEKAKADAKANGTETKPACTKEQKAACTKEQKAACTEEQKAACTKETKKSCCPSKDASKTEGATETSTEKK